MDNQEHKDDVYLEPTVELDDSGVLAAQGQEIAVLICTSGC